MLKKLGRGLRGFGKKLQSEMKGFGRKLRKGVEDVGIGQITKDAGDKIKHVGEEALNRAGLAVRRGGERLGRDLARTAESGISRARERLNGMRVR